MRWNKTITGVPAGSQDIKNKENYSNIARSLAVVIRSISIRSSQRSFRV